MHRPPHEHPLLSRVTSPAELRRIPRDRLPAHPAEELRRCLADHVSMPPGVLAPSLEVVELAVALHYVYKTPQDRLVWDGGQTTYAHKLLTGRRPRLHAARQKAQLVATRGRGEKAAMTNSAPPTQAAPSAWRSAYRAPPPHGVSAAASSQSSARVPWLRAWPSRR